MKRIITSTLLLSALALFSACQKSEQQAPAKGESIVFTASFAPETKTVINGKQSLWDQDEIRIFNGNHTEAQEYVTTAVKTATADFTIKNPEATFTGDKFIAVCPNSLATNAWWNGSADKTINKLWLKPEQTATAGTYDPEGHVAVAYTENTTLSFRNACALLKFTIKSDNIKEVCVYSTDAVLSGNFNFNTEGQGSITTTAVGEDTYVSNNYVKVKGDFVNGQTYYMSCIPGTLANGFTLEVVNDKAAKGKDNVYTKPIELKRNSIYNLGEVKYEERPTETRTFYLKAGDWAQGGAVIDAWIWGESITGQWVDFEKIGEKEFKAELSKGTTGIKLYRRSPIEHKIHEHENNHWDTSGDLTISDANDCLTFSGWNDKIWTAGNYSE
mgnify:CR=1 FL=1